MAHDSIVELLALSMECFETVDVLTWSHAGRTGREYTRTLIGLLVYLEHRTTDHPKKARLQDLELYFAEYGR